MLQSKFQGWAPKNDRWLNKQIIAHMHSCKSNSFLVLIFSWKHQKMNSKTFKNIKWDYKDASQRLLKLMYRSKINHFIFACSSKTCWTRLIFNKLWKLLFISEHMNFYQTSKNNDRNYCLPSFENNRSSFFCLTRRFWNQIFTFKNLTQMFDGKIIDNLTSIFIYHLVFYDFNFFFHFF